MRYPLDALTADKLFGHLIASDRSQRQMIEALTILLQEAINETDEDEYDLYETGWIKDAKKLIKLQIMLKVDHDNRIFNEKNGVAEKPSIARVTPESVKESYSETMPNLGIMGIGQISDPRLNADINQREKSFGEEMSEEEIAKMFNEKPKKKLKDGIDLSAKEPFKGMTIEQIEEWERKQENTNDIYKIKARVQNMVVASGGALTPVGEMMVNSFVHVAKDLYDFAETIPDKSLKISLIERIRKHEGMPASLIEAAAAGVKINK